MKSTEIIELQQRIVALEQRVAQLEATIGRTNSDNVSSAPRRSYSKVNGSMLDACYSAAKEYGTGEQASIRRLADKVQSKTGMNRNNAFMTILVAYALLNGEVYKRTVSGKATEFFFDKILQEQGKSGLARAVGAVRAHINYRRALHHNVDKLERLCEQYEKQL